MHPRPVLQEPAVQLVLDGGEPDGQHVLLLGRQTLCQHTVVTTLRTEGDREGQASSHLLESTTGGS